MPLLGICSLFLMAACFLASFLTEVNSFFFNASALLSLSFASCELGCFAYSKRVGYAAFALILFFPANLFYLFSPLPHLIYAAICLWALVFCKKVFFFLKGEKVPNTLRVSKTFLPFCLTSLFLGSTFASLFELFDKSLTPFFQERLVICLGSLSVLSGVSLYYSLKVWQVGFLHRYDSLAAGISLSLFFTYLLFQEPAFFLAAIPFLLIFSVKSHFLRLSRCMRP